MVRYGTIKTLGHSANDLPVLLDYANTNVEYHLLETPDLLDLVREALPAIVLTDEAQQVIEKDMGRVIGTTNLVETTDRDEIVYAKRLGRDMYSRFAKDRQPEPCHSIVIVIRKQQGYCYLWTAMCGKRLPDDAYQPDSVFSATHAIAYDETLMQTDTITTEKPA